MLNRSTDNVSAVIGTQSSMLVNELDLYSNIKPFVRGMLMAICKGKVFPFSWLHHFPLFLVGLFFSYLACQGLWKWSKHSICSRRLHKIVNSLLAWWARYRPSKNSRSTHTKGDCINNSSNKSLGVKNSSSHDISVCSWWESYYSSWRGSGCNYFCPCNPTLFSTLFK